MGGVARSPIIVVILELVVGALVARGVVEGQHKEEVIGLMADVIGALIYVITAMFAMHRFFDFTKHHVTKQAEMQLALPEASYSGIPEKTSTTSQTVVTNTTTSGTTFVNDPTPTIIGDNFDTIGTIEVPNEDKL